MKLKEFCLYLDTIVPVSFQESYDNSGLQTGDPESDIISALISLDITEEVIDEALQTGCNLVVSHHPLIFNPLKKLTGRNSVERILIRAVKNDIAIYSAHTNLDIFNGGVSRKMADKLNLKNIKVLRPLEKRLLKLVTFIPADHLEKVREALFKAGAGVIGNYDRCSFSLEGTGSFRGAAGTHPFAGKPENFHFEKETRFETILPVHLKEPVIAALLETHPYEEVAYDLYLLENEFYGAGLGCTGDLPAQLAEMDFLKQLNQVFTARGVRYSGLTGKKIKKVALCGGAGISLLTDAIRSGADAYVTSDIKYHDFFSPEKKILLVDIGHYESEKFSREILYDLIIKKIPTFAVRFSETNTNPINYL